MGRSVQSFSKRMRDQELKERRERKLEKKAARAAARAAGELQPPEAVDGESPDGSGVAEDA